MNCEWLSIFVRSFGYFIFRSFLDWLVRCRIRMRLRSSLPLELTMMKRRLNIEYRRFSCSYSKPVECQHIGASCFVFLLERNKIGRQFVIECITMHRKLTQRIENGAGCEKMNPFTFTGHWTTLMKVKLRIIWIFYDFTFHLLSLSYVQRTCCLHRSWKKILYWHS